MNAPTVVTSRLGNSARTEWFPSLKVGGMRTELKIERQASSDKATLGYLYIDGNWECYTLEDVVRELPGVPVAQWKIPNETAIPAGRYKVIIDFSNRFQRPMPHVLNVPGFDGIRIHSGNTDANTEGCILLGQAVRGPDFIERSRDAFSAFFTKLQRALDAGAEVMLTIVPAALAPGRAA